MKGAKKVVGVVEYLNVFQGLQLPRIQPPRKTVLRYFFLCVYRRMVPYLFRILREKDIHLK